MHDHWLAVRVLALASLFALTLAACGGGGAAPPPVGNPPAQPVFLPEGLEGRVVLNLYRNGDELLAATDDGLYGKQIGQDSWQPRGLEALRVRDITIISSSHWLATVSRTGPNPFVEPRLMETVNGGANWLEVENDFGGGLPENLGMFRVLYDAASGLLYATETEALAVSSDLGRSWMLVSGFWGGFAMGLDALSIDRAQGEIWFGGQNALEQMVMRRHDLATGETTIFPSTLLPAPAVIDSINTDPRDPNHVLASGEGGILQSFDNGTTWRRPLGDVNHRFYFQTAFDETDPDVIYTAGWTKTELPQPLVLEVSRDRGASWTSFEHNPPGLLGGVWSLIVVPEEGRTVIYVGLDRGGIMKIIMSPDS